MHVDAAAKVDPSSALLAAHAAFASYFVLRKGALHEYARIACCNDDFDAVFESSAICIATTAALMHLLRLTGPPREAAALFSSGRAGGEEAVVKGAGPPALAEGAAAVLQPSDPLFEWTDEERLYISFSKHGCGLPSCPETQVAACLARTWDPEATKVARLKALRDIADIM